MKKKKGYGSIYGMTNKNKRVIAGVIGGIMVLATVLGAIASIFMG